MSVNTLETLPLYCRFSSHPVSRLAKDRHVMAIIGFSADNKGPDLCPDAGEDAPFIASGLLPPKPYDRGINEVWYCEQALTRGTERLDLHNNTLVTWAKSSHYLFVSLTWDEQDNSDLCQQTYQLYHYLLNFIDRQGYGHLLRIWNYLPHINQGELEEERYKRFCQGRYEAFKENGLDSSHFPAASALGHRQRQSVIYLLAATEPGLHIENPTQCSAYRYPPAYGRRSPAFARATCYRDGQYTLVFLSGTASIIGHETQHPQHCDKQLQVTFSNIESLFTHIQQQLSHRPGLRLDHAKVYVRHPEDIPVAKAMVSAYLSPKAHILYLQGDICRENLLVEIEGLCHVASKA